MTISVYLSGVHDNFCLLIGSSRQFLFTYWEFMTISVYLLGVFTYWDFMTISVYLSGAHNDLSWSTGFRAI